MPPITLNNRYKYNPDTDELGKGGLGTVYKAYDVQQERYVAIKKFNAADSLKYSLRAEFQKSIHFSHGNLVRAYDFFSTTFTDPNGETHETQYGVMELIAGGDLAQYLSTQPTLPELLAVTKGILRGLDYLHTPDPNTDKGIVIHRDIKPANILIFRNKEGKPIPKITDFNIAKEASTEVSTQTAIGTHEYMSPEQYLPPKYGTNGKVLPNADLWALGLLLCDHLLNRSVFGRRNNGQTKGTITHNILSETLPTAEIQNLPAPFNQIVAQCLVHHAPKRVQSAKELLAMIDRYENSVEDTIKVVPPKPKPRVVPEDTYVPNKRETDTEDTANVIMLDVSYWDNVEGAIKVINSAKSIDTPKSSFSNLWGYEAILEKISLYFAVFGFSVAAFVYFFSPTTELDTTDPSTAETTPAQPEQPTATTIGGGDKPYIKMISIPGSNLKMSETEVTIGQYLAFCNATNSHYPEWLEQGNDYNIHTGTDDWYKKIGMSESNTNYPITGVSATDADAFCRWMGGRLPTEQEWEYAANGGQSYEYAGSDNIDEVAWYYDNSGSKAHPVKQKRANGYGLYDMSGNVWEWTSSTEGSYRVLRGGSWDDGVFGCGVAYRRSGTPGNRSNYIGFRLVCIP